MRSVHGLLIVEKGAGVENTPLEARVRQTVRGISLVFSALWRAACLASLFAYISKAELRAAHDTRHTSRRITPPSPPTATPPVSRTAPHKRIKIHSFASPK